MKKLKIIASAGALLLVSLQAHAGDIISSVVSTTTEFKVVNSAEAEVTVSARKDLATGSVPVGFRLGSFSSSVSAGTVAFRLNRTINPAIPGSTLVHRGQASNSNDPSKKLNIYIGTPSGSQEIDGWRVLTQGVTSYSGGFFVQGSPQVLLAGRYPVGIDVAAYAF